MTRPPRPSTSMRAVTARPPSVNTTQLLAGPSAWNGGTRRPSPSGAPPKAPPRHRPPLAPPPPHPRRRPRRAGGGGEPVHAGRPGVDVPAALAVVGEER